MTHIGHRKAYNRISAGLTCYVLVILGFMFPQMWEDVRIQGTLTDFRPSKEETVVAEDPFHAGFVIGKLTRDQDI